MCLRVLFSAAEKLQWPLPVDYPSAKVEVRKEFESAFLNLLRLQELCVSMVTSLIMLFRTYEINSVGKSLQLVQSYLRVVRRTACTPFKHLFVQLHYASSITSKALVKLIG